MTFLNGVMLSGAAACAIPLAIHLLNRNRPRTVRWGAMQLLEPRANSSRRQIEMEQLLLLLLRISIPILLALCMARPIASGLKSSNRTTTASVVIILDDSASMNASTGETSSFEKAKASAVRCIESLGRGSEIAVISSTDPKQPLIQTTSDTNGAVQNLKRLSPSHRTADISASIEIAARHLSLMHNSTQRIVVFSDFQTANWSQDDASRLQDAVNRLSALKHKPAITLFDTGPFESENTAILSVEFTRLPVAPNQKVRFDATLRNFGTQPKTNIPVYWKIDGLPAAKTNVTIAPGQSTQVGIERSFETPGPHMLEAHIDGDSFASDNTFYATLNIQRSIGVLLVSGKISREPLQGETDFLQLALNPGARAQRDAGIFSIKTVSPEELNAKHLLESRVVVLANTPRLKESQIRLLENFVAEGGGLALFPGSRTDVAWCNEQLYKNGMGLIPAKLGSAAGNSSAGLPGIEIASGPYLHPSLNAFNSEQNNLSGVQIQAWYKLSTTQIAKTRGTDPTPLNPSPEYSDNEPFIFLSLENGDPLLVECKYGSGLVMQSAIPCSADWSNFPTRPTFVPAMQRLIGHLAIGAQASTQLEVGSPILACFTGSNAPSGIQSPDGTLRALAIEKVDGRTHVHFEQTQQPGFYRMTCPDGTSQCFAINADRAESNPARVGSKELESLTESLGATVALNASALSDSLATSSAGREVWEVILCVILVLLFAEIGLQQRFNQRAPSSK
jgi:hypothetical protein